jgi:tRNA (uracil-5-)-methyltransferase TRM9
VDIIVAKQLIELNQQFYQTFALQFSETRRRIQPGVRQMLSAIPKSSSILDVGCGNGELWHFLHASGFKGAYLGLDSSTGLLEIARQTDLPNISSKPVFIHADLTESSWNLELYPGKSIHDNKTQPGRFDFVLAFAVLHHIPSVNLRLEILKKIRGLVSTEGQFIHSEWQFLNSAKLKQRIQPWEVVGLQDSSVDEGDYLLDWRSGGRGFRYVHVFQEDELAILASEADFEIQTTYYSDGQGGNLSIYQTWSAVK